jgi:formylglycine-generating enzyme required for sulfatase activity
MNAEMPTDSSPYVGPVPFERQHQNLFFGRQREIRQLMYRLIPQRIVLLHSPSGAGKTSLIQAGLIPALEEEEETFQILPTMQVGQMPRPEDLKDLTVSNRYVLSALLSLEEELAGKGRPSLAELVEMEFGAYLAERRPPDEDRPNQVLIFDQFEELLTADPTDTQAKAAFFRQVGAVLQHPRRWALFSMREDYLAGLDPYLHPVPGRLETRFRLDLLDKEAALAAIQMPAAAVGVTFRDDAAGRLCKELSKVRVQSLDGTSSWTDGPYAEPILLQVVCQHLWALKGSQVEEITLKLVESIGSVDQALSDYYSQQVKAIASETGVSELSIRDWFENRLITIQGVRTQVLQEPGQSGGLDNKAIERLVRAHLVRPERRRGLTWYELAHDRLIEPVRQDNELQVQSLEALARRYAKLVHEIASELGVHEGRIRDWLDQKLITEQGTRSLVRETEIEREGLKVAVDRLVDLGLVRKERRRGDTWYELAHDRLIEPVRADNAAWRWARLSVLPRQARLWEEEGRPGFLLLDGEALEQAETWAQSHPDELTPIDREFLHESQNARDAAVRERQLARRIRWLAAGATILAVIACFLACVAGLQTYRLGQEGDARLTLQAQHDQTSVAQSDNAAATWAAGATEIATVTLPERATQAAYAVATLTAQVLAASPTPTPTLTPIETPTATASPTRPGETPIPTEPVLSTDTPTPTQTATPDETQAAVQATVHVIQTVEMQLTGEPPTATAQVGDCAYEPQGDFGELWKTAEVQRGLGCPGSVYPVGGTFAEQAFEGGRMIWSQIGDQFFVIVYGKQGAGEGTWLLYPATEIPVINPDGVSCKADPQPPPGLMQPVRGFGGVWCHLDPKTREAIGFATEVERSVTGNLIQQFEAGWVLRDSKNSVYVFFEYEGRYVRGDIVFVPGGELSMGSADDQGQPDEQPRARVSISGFWLDRFEVTNAEYRRCVETGICRHPHRENDGPIEVRSFTRSDYYTNPKFDQFPVLFVSWHDASAYCTWSGRRLPTEAEWEWAAKGRRNYLYPWGNVPEPSASLANFASNVGDTRAVGQYAASPLGLYDMAGNVWEWTSSLYRDYPYNPKDGREDPTAAGDRVLRGGSWRDGPENLRTANRDAIGPGWSLDNVGFRCAMSTQ